MIDDSNRIIYVDHSTLAVHRACREKCRLQSAAGWHPAVQDVKLTFGHAMHAAIAGYYDQRAGGFFDETKQWHKREMSPLLAAKHAFLGDLKIEGHELPLTMEAEERRSIERGLGLVEAYFDRWGNEMFENIIIDGKPCTEIGFQYPLTTFEGYDVVYVGYIDRLMRRITTKRPVIFETKTTTMGLSQFILQCKPNHQVTGYFPAATKILGDEPIYEAMWDCIFISSRKSDMAKALRDRHWLYGIDKDADFGRQATTRSKTDIAEWFIDIENDALDYCKWLTSKANRWPRNAPGSCHAYGGCQFRNRCSMNLDDNQEESYMMSTGFVRKKWEPWRGIVGIIKESPG